MARRYCSDMCAHVLFGGEVGDGVCERQVWFQGLLDKGYLYFQTVLFHSHVQVSNRASMGIFLCGLR
jgi:hypothetical protein